VATLRERRPGVWEIRVFTGRDDAGRPTQVSKTVRGTKREAKRAAAALESRPASHAAGRTVAEVIDAWREVNEAVWSEATRRDYASRAGAIAKDPIAGIGLARLGVGDVERWHARMRKTGVGEASIRSPTACCAPRSRKRCAGSGSAPTSPPSPACASPGRRPDSR
jgi:integrase